MKYFFRPRLFTVVGLIWFCLASGLCLSGVIPLLTDNVFVGQIPTALQAGTSYVVTDPASPLVDWLQFRGAFSHAISVSQTVLGACGMLLVGLYLVQIRWAKRILFLYSLLFITGFAVSQAQGLLRSVMLLAESLGGSMLSPAVVFGAVALGVGSQLGLLSLASFLLSGTHEEQLAGSQWVAA